MKRILASIRDSRAMFWWASRIRAVSLKQSPEADWANIFSDNSDVMLMAVGKVKYIIIIIIYSP